MFFVNPRQVKVQDDFEISMGVKSTFSTSVVYPPRHAAEQQTPAASGAEVCRRKL